MENQTVKVNIPTIKTVIGIGGKELAITFRAMKRNEKLKLQSDIKHGMALLKKESRTEEEDQKIVELLDGGSSRATDLIQSVESTEPIFIEGQEITLDSIKSGELPEVFYSALTAAYSELNNRLAKIKAEAETKNDVPLIDSPKD